MDLNSLRQKIDRHDSRIVKLLNQRLALAAKIGRLKRSKDGRIFVAEREDEVLRKVCGQNQGPIKDVKYRATRRYRLKKELKLGNPGPLAR